MGRLGVLLPCKAHNAKCPGLAAAVKVRLEAPLLVSLPISYPSPLTGPAFHWGPKCPWLSPASVTSSCLECITRDTRDKVIGGGDVSLHLSTPTGDCSQFLLILLLPAGAVGIFLRGDRMMKLSKQAVCDFMSDVRTFFL